MDFGALPVDDEGSGNVPLPGIGGGNWIVAEHDPILLSPRLFIAWITPGGNVPSESYLTQTEIGNSIAVYGIAAPCGAFYFVTFDFDGVAADDRDGDESASGGVFMNLVSGMS